MIEFNLIYISLFAIYLLLFLTLTIFGNIIYQFVNKKKFSYFNTFPYEILDNVDQKLSLPYRIILLIYSGFAISPLILIFTSFSSWGNLIYLVTFIAILIFINALFYLGIAFLPAKFIRQHTLLATLYFVFNILISALVSLLGFLLYFTYNTSLPHLIFACFSILLTIIGIIVILNPKLKEWAKLNKETNEKGETSIVRPKFFPLAYSEWLFYLISLFNVVMTFLTFLSI